MRRMAQVQHMACPRCGEVHPIDRDSLPIECPCGYSIGLADLLAQMSAVADAQKRSDLLALFSDLQRSYERDAKEAEGISRPDLAELFRTARRCLDDARAIVTDWPILKARVGELESAIAALERERDDLANRLRGSLALNREQIEAIKRIERERDALRTYSRITKAERDEAVRRNAALVEAVEGLVKASRRVTGFITVDGRLLRGTDFDGYRLEAALAALDAALAAAEAAGKEGE